MAEIAKDATAVSNYHLGKFWCDLIQTESTQHRNSGNFANLGKPGNSGSFPNPT
jgi:hypothetical protein